MDFDEALARTINLLERQGFATYRTLKRRFHLDDAILAALTTTLMDTQHLAQHYTEAGAMAQAIPYWQRAGRRARARRTRKPSAILPRD